MPKKPKESPTAIPEPEASRPHVPGYGIPTTKKGMLSWSHADERLARSRHYWVATASSDGRPRVAFAWDKDLRTATRFRFR
jgi:hypothetical protein